MVPVQAFYDKSREQYVCMEKSLPFLSVQKKIENIQTKLEDTLKGIESDIKQDLTIGVFFSLRSRTTPKFFQNKN